MVHSINPGGILPYMQRGDICVIGGKEYPFIGRIRSVKELGNASGVYILESNGKYYLRHPKKETEIIDAFRESQIEAVATGIAENPIAAAPNYVREIFDPPITESDNYLKVKLKKIIHYMQIDIRDYKNRFQNDNHYNNMRRLLVTDANLTIEKFQEWMDILDCAYEMKVYAPNGIEIID